MSAKTYSTYRPPIVEDASSTSSGSVGEVRWGGSDKSASHKSRSKDGSARGWEGSQANSQHWNDSVKGSEKGWSQSAHDEATSQHWSGSAHEKTTSQQWGGSQNRSRVGAASETSTRSRGSQGRRRVPSEQNWDGFERVKTASEVSVAGSDGSGRTSFGDRSWGGEGRSKKKSDDGWGGSGGGGEQRSEWGRNEATPEGV
ncbi:hypothetical protein P153DRAFT_370023 [Dothidotthia symphoricarpi CBS 119687]|uniref:Uncharacterized protein n=1 Tax=Dothidotthia symphoricarpi CBS 119687 TaxID=1392245 RepID=A0A6A6A433_9PLEO|nr:uncharacterized protein P153DRAFT_370023 [Dothidotthia symphoricarpi CBS 119687]KAF2125351.1 hypothetical protein P153DRAFT_370023 [Dothidotthia symphoricarpi CBS 119687]